MGKWLARLAEAYTTLIPKDERPVPFNSRPIAVFSMVYRLRASIRVTTFLAVCFQRCNQNFLKTPGHCYRYWLLFLSRFPDQNFQAFF